MCGLAHAQGLVGPDRSRVTLLIWSQELGVALKDPFCSFFSGSLDFMSVPSMKPCCCARPNSLESRAGPTTLLAPSSSRVALAIAAIWLVHVWSGLRPAAIAVRTGFRLDRQDGSSASAGREGGRPRGCGPARHVGLTRSCHVAHRPCPCSKAALLIHVGCSCAPVSISGRSPRQP